VRHCDTALRPDAAAGGPEGSVGSSRIRRQPRTCDTARYRTSAKQPAPTTRNEPDARGASETAGRDVVRSRAHAVARRRAPAVVRNCHQNCAMNNSGLPLRGEKGQVTTGGAEGTRTPDPHTASVVRTSTANAAFSPRESAFMPSHLHLLLCGGSSLVSLGSLT
jgi:hypothetical protein